MLSSRHAVVTGTASFTKVGSFIKEAKKGRTTANLIVHRKIAQSVDGALGDGLDLWSQISQVEIRLIPCKVCVIRKHEGLCREAVAAGATDLLIVLFHSLGRSPMNNTSRIRLIDAKAKRSGRHNNYRFTN